ncbi:hypothetical protein AOLI_G00264830 [Acnodon oligacanthus]
MSQGDAELEQMAAKRDGEIIRLREEVQRLQLTLQEAQQSTANHISRLQRQLASKIENIERLKAILDSQQDYEKIKEELRILKERKRTPEHFHLLSLSSPSSERAVLDVQEDVLFQKALAEHTAVSDHTGVEIKSEVQKLPHSSAESVEQLSKPESSRRTTPSPRPQCLSPYDAVPHLCIKTNNSTEGSLKVDVSGVGESDLSANAWDGRALEGNVMEGRVLEKKFETAEIAQQVKELLHQHKIGQRVFGRFILGRLQGSVSEILAHPKPWSKLTARGKEPFLRMVRFLSDGQNVLALRTIQDRLRAELDPSLKISGSSSPVIHSAVMGSDDAIRNILEQAKKELQSQNGENEAKDQQDHRRYTQIYAAHDDNTMRGGSEDIIKGILEQAKHEMQVQQNTEDHNSGTAGDHLMASSLQMKQEVEERCALDQHPPDHGLLKAASPTDFVQNIIRKVKSEIGAESTRSASSPLLPAWSSSSPPSIAHPPFSDKQNPSLNRKQDTVLSSNTKGEMQFFGINVSPGKFHSGYGGPNQPLLESYKENFQPPQTQDGQSCGTGTFSQLHPDFYSRLDTETLQLPELDTQRIARRVKEVLAENNLGQRLFGEQVLGLTQGTVSDLLARPKPWHELSVKGREPFLRMDLWLKDPHNVEYLKALKSTGHRAHLKRPFTLISTGSEDPSQDSLLDSIVDHPGQFNMAKRPRVVLTSQEKEVLVRVFRLEPYPSHHTTQRLALELGLQPSTVTNWFYNHRSRLRRTAQDGHSVTTDYNHSPFPDVETVTQHCFSDPSPCSFGSPPCTDTNLGTFKQEPSDVEISEVKEEDGDISWNSKYVSTGVQSCSSMKLEEEEDRRVLSPQPEDGTRFEMMVKEDPDGAHQDSGMFSAEKSPARDVRIAAIAELKLKANVNMDSEGQRDQQRDLKSSTSSEFVMLGSDLLKRIEEEAFIIRQEMNAQTKDVLHFSADGPTKEDNVHELLCGGAPGESESRDGEHEEGFL